MIYVVLITAALCLCIVIASRLQVKKAYDDMDGILDGLLNKRRADPLTLLKDDRSSKLRFKASKIAELYVSDAEAARQEKETVQSLISDLSHQMKTPLAGICMYSQLLLKEDVPREQFCGRIKSLSDKLQWMTDCLFKVSRLETGAIRLSPSPRPIRETIGAAVETVIAQAAKKGMEISVSGSEGLCLFHDGKWTAEALSNVLDNAVKYSPAGSPIEIDVRPLVQYTKITVRDRGMGVAKEECNQIFKRFYRGKNAADCPGSGLGLYLTRLILEKQGGFIMAESLENGTAVSIFLQNCKK